jgi:hypothetical protein
MAMDSISGYLVVSKVLLGGGELIFTRLLNEGTLKRWTYKETQSLHWRSIFQYLL